MIRKLSKQIRQSSLYVEHNKKIKFLMTGGFNTLLDFLIYGLLANLIGLYAVIASIVSTSVCMLISFFLNYNFVWRSKKSKRDTAPKFLIVSLFSAWIVQSVIIFIITGIFGENANLVAKLIGVSCGMISNYLGYKLVFN